MANNDNITTKFSVDISDLKAGISQANQQIKLANAQFKAATAGMKDWESSADGITAKLKQLDSVLQAQTAKLENYKEQLQRQQEAYSENGKRAEELKAKMADLAANGVEKTSREYQSLEKELLATEKAQAQNQSAIDKLNVTILNQEAAVKKTTAEFNDYQGELKDLSNAEDRAEGDSKDLEHAVEDVGDEADKTGKKFDGLGKKIASGLKKGLAAAGTAIAGAGAGLVKMTVSAGEYADEMLTLSTVTGMSTDELQAYNYMAEQVDVSMETLTGSMKKNIKSMSSASGGTGAAAEAYKKLGVSVTDSNGKLRDGETVYWEAIDALGKMEEGSERDALAMQIFGKSATDLNPLIEQGSEGVAKLTEEAEAMGAVMSEDSLQALGNFDDSMQRMKGGAEAAKNALGTVLLPQLQLLADDGTELLGQFTQGIVAAEGDWGKVSEVIGQTFGSLADMLLSALPKLVEVAKQIVEALFGSILDNLPMVMDVAVELATSLGDFLIQQTPKLVKTGSQLIISLLQGLSEALPLLIGSLTLALPDIVSSITDAAPLMLQAGIQLLMSLVDALPMVTEILLGELPSMVASVVDMLVQSIPVVLDGAVQLFMGIIQALPTIISQLQSALPSIIDTLVAGLINSTGLLIDGAVQLLMAICDSIPVFLPTLMSMVPSIVLSIGNALIQNLPMLLQSAVTLFMALCDAIPTVLVELGKQVPQIVSAILEALSGLGAQLGELFSSAWQAAKDIFANVGEWFGEKFGGAWDTIKEKFSHFAEFFSDLWEKVKESFSALGTKIGDAISGAVKAGINGVIASVERIINGAINIINGAIGLINKIPGVSVGTINPVSFPRLERGGVLKKGQIGFLEGSGSEAVVPLDKNKAWISAVASDLLDQLRVTGGMANSVSNISNNRTANFTQVINAPKTPTRIELYRQTKNLFDYAASTGVI